ncbi:chromosomal replication initiator protein DnaA, partial [Nitratireductor aquibiodomus RA22]
MQSGAERETTGGFSFQEQMSQQEGKETTEAGKSDSKAGPSEAIFERVKTQLRARLGSEVYSSWFGRMKLMEPRRLRADLCATAF